MSRIKPFKLAHFAAAILEECKDGLADKLAKKGHSIEKHFQSAFGDQLKAKGFIFDQECQVVDIAPEANVFDRSRHFCDFVVLKDVHSLVGIEIKCVEFPSIRYMDSRYNLSQLTYDAGKLAGNVLRQPKKTKKKCLEQIFQSAAPKAKKRKLNQKFLLLLAFGRNLRSFDNSYHYAVAVYRQLYVDQARIAFNYPKRKELRKLGRKIGLNVVEPDSRKWSYAPYNNPPVGSAIAGDEYYFWIVVHELS